MHSAHLLSYMRTCVLLKTHSALLKTHSAVVKTHSVRLKTHSALFKTHSALLKTEGPGRCVLLKTHVRVSFPTSAPKDTLQHSLRLPSHSAHLLPCLRIQKKIKIPDSALLSVFNKQKLFSRRECSLRQTRSIFFLTSAFNDALCAFKDTLCTLKTHSARSKTHSALLTTEGDACF